MRMAYQYKREPLTQDEATRLAQACTTYKERLVVWGLLDTGLRVSELSGLTREHIDWQGLFGTTKSPLAHLGGGGLSGEPLLQLLHGWIVQARVAGIKKPLNAGGGILSLKDAKQIMEACAFKDGEESSIALGSIAILRPWRVQKIISRMNSH